MTPEQYQKVTELFESLVQLNPAEPGHWLDSQGVDSETRATVLRMLEEDRLLEDDGDDRLFPFMVPQDKQAEDSDAGNDTGGEDETAVQTADKFGPLGLKRWPWAGTNLFSWLYSESEPLTSGGTTSSIAPTGGRLQKDQLFGNYTILEEIGRGSMGVVYRAEQKLPNRVVALKTIRAGDFASDADIQRFVNESQATAQLNHENIVPVYEVGCEEGAHFYSMQWVDGTNLSEVLQGDELDRKSLLEIFEKIVRAVAYCHENGIVHRDLKPSNILLDAQLNPKVSDFGLAKNLEVDSTLTAVGDLMGTPGYMAPELVQGLALPSLQKTLDVYSLGAILYHLLTGRPPIQARDVNLMGAIQLIRDHDVVSPRIFDRRIAKDLDTICTKCLETDPAARYADAGELLNELEVHLQGEPIKSRGLSLTQRVIRWAKHRPGLAVSWTATTLLMVWHLVNYYFLGVGLSNRFHWSATGLAFLWAFGAWGFQRALLFFGGRSLIHFAWATMDVVILSLLLLLPEMDGANAHLVFAFFPIVAVSALRMRLDLVAYVTVLSILAYLGHVLRNNLVTDLTDINQSTYVTFPLCIATLGLIEYFSLRRSQFAIESFRKRVQRK